MREIVKGAEPASLTTHRKTAHCDYDNYPDKNGLRAALVTEQAGLCCYCMGRIRSVRTKMKIEHWRCKTHYPAEQLTYRNLLGACRGGEGQPLRLQHCDTRKRQSDLQWNPADPVHRIETRVRYLMDGTIRANDTDFDSELDAILNLNLPIIKNNRKGVLDALLIWWSKLPRAVRRQRLAAEVASRTNASGPLEPFVQVAVWWLRQKLTRMSP